MIEDIPVFIQNTVVPPRQKKLTGEQAKEIYLSKLHVKELAYQYNVCLGTIYRIKRKTLYKRFLPKGKKHVG